jgi:hypothetical protein
VGGIHYYLHSICSERIQSSESNAASRHYNKGIVTEIAVQRVGTFSIRYELLGWRHGDVVAFLDNHRLPEKKEDIGEKVVFRISSSLVRADSRWGRLGRHIAGNMESPTFSLLPLPPVAYSENPSRGVPLLYSPIQMCINRRHADSRAGRAHQFGFLVQSRVNMCGEALRNGAVAFKFSVRRFCSFSFSFAVSWPLTDILSTHTRIQWYCTQG